MWVFIWFDFPGFLKSTEGLYDVIKVKKDHAASWYIERANHSRGHPLLERPNGHAEVFRKGFLAEEFWFNFFSQTVKKFHRACHKEDRKFGIAMSDEGK